MTYKLDVGGRGGIYYSIGPTEGDLPLIGHMVLAMNQILDVLNREIVPNKPMSSSSYLVDPDYVLLRNLEANANWRDILVAIATLKHWLKTGRSKIKQHLNALRNMLDQDAELESVSTIATTTSEVRAGMGKLAPDAELHLYAGRPRVVADAVMVDPEYEERMVSLFDAIQDHPVVQTTSYYKDMRSPESRKLPRHYQRTEDPAPVKQQVKFLEPVPELNLSDDTHSKAAFSAGVGEVASEPDSISAVKRLSVNHPVNTGPVFGQFFRQYTLLSLIPRHPALPVDSATNTPFPYYGTSQSTTPRVFSSLPIPPNMSVTMDQYSGKAVIVPTEPTPRMRDTLANAPAGVSTIPNPSSISANVSMVALSTGGGKGPPPPPPDGGSGGFPNRGGGWPSGGGFPPSGPPGGGPFSSGGQGGPPPPGGPPASGGPPPPGGPPPGGPGGTTDPYQGPWQGGYRNDPFMVSRKIPIPKLPTWDGNGDTLIDYLLKMGKLARIGTEMIHNLGKITPLTFISKRLLVPS